MPLNKIAHLKKIIILLPGQRKSSPPQVKAPIYKLTSRLLERVGLRADSLKKVDFEKKYLTPLLSLAAEIFELKYASI